MLARKLTKKLEGSIVDRVRQRMMKSASLRRRQWRSNRRWNVKRSLRPLLDTVVRRISGAPFHEPPALRVFGPKPHHARRLSVFTETLYHAPRHAVALAAMAVLHSGN